MITKDYKKALAILNNHGVIICDAFTLYGFSANLFDVLANKKILLLKKRDALKPFIVIANSDFIFDVAVDVDRCLLEKLLSLSVSAVLKTRIQMPFYASQNGFSAFRVANTEFLKKICSHFPITSTSVNISGKESLLNLSDLIQRFSNRVDCICAGKPIGVASTVVKLEGRNIEILRKGFNYNQVLEVKNG
ncbi:L-threonylcarbamoyladenylate synthase [Hippea jasoniae]|uniref:L-threonylcarbamoyladenylate synthase n=1 Tax=Hippea jasoniae TaxID=944479 RepID=UPI000A4E0097|nr:Sua5/YciO/YrdC/YwlC family protein [Hippea jasoniae]